MLLAILILNGIFFLICQWNLWVYRAFGGRSLDSVPFVSMLVPCRNEASHLEACVGSLLRQDYPSFEVLVYDDESTDGSREILAKLEAASERLRVIFGEGLPQGWTGKNHACFKLASAARGSWILFVDADTLHHPQMLKRAMETVLYENASFLSTFPRQTFSSRGDEFFVPLVFFIFMCFLPIFFVSRRTWRWVGEFSAACGQFLLFEKKAYFDIGGHAAVKGALSEAIRLAGKMKVSGKKIVLRDGSPWVSCRMYAGFKEAFFGFSRSVFPSMGNSLKVAFFFFLVQTFLYIFPLGTLLASLLVGSSARGEVFLSLLALGMPLFIRRQVSRRFKMSDRFYFLHPFSIAVYNAVILNSLIWHLFRKKAVWKERSYAPVRV